MSTCDKQIDVTRDDVDEKKQEIVDVLLHDIFLHANLHPHDVHYSVLGSSGPSTASYEIIVNEDDGRDQVVFVHGSFYDPQVFLDFFESIIDSLEQ